MMGQKDVMLVDGVRTAIGDFGGSLRDKPPTELDLLLPQKPCVARMWTQQRWTTPFLAMSSIQKPGTCI